MPIPSSQSIETSLFANVPKEDTPPDQRKTNDVQEDAMGRVKDKDEPTRTQHKERRISALDTAKTPNDDVMSLTTPTPATTATPSTNADNVYLQVARVLLIVVIVLSILYLAYWVLQNVFDIDPLAKLTEFVDASPLSNFSKPLNQLSTLSAPVGASVATALAVPSVSLAAPSVSSSTPLPEAIRSPPPPSTPPRQQPQQLPPQPPSRQEEPTPTQPPSTSLFAPLQNLFRSSTTSSAPHTDGVVAQRPSLRGPLTAEGSKMKKELSDKSVSALLDLMSQIQ